MRGRKPKPAALKLAGGQTRPSRVNYQEPHVPAADLVPPKHLKGAGLALWNGLGAKLIEAGSLRSSDIPMFVHVCEIEMVVAKLRPRVMAGDSQAMREWRQQLAVQTRQMTELGMSSVARSRVKAEPSERKDADEERYFGVVNGGKA